MLQIIHISDTHVGPTSDFEVRGSRPLERLDALIDSINRLALTPDLVLHTGDVVNEPDHDAYRLASKSLQRLKAPVYFVAGNHDDVPMMRQHLPEAPHVSLAAGGDRLCYRIDLGDHRIFVLDGKVPEDEGPHGRLPEDQLEALAGELKTWQGEFSVFLHFPPLPIGSRWIDAHLPLQNGAALHELLLSAGVPRNRGVFFGHLHRGLQIYREGILYSAVSSPACQFSTGPDDDIIAFESDCPLAFNHLTILPGTTVVKEHTPVFD